MTEQKRMTVSRREALAAGAGALTIGTFIAQPSRAQDAAVANAIGARRPADPNAFVRIGADSKVTVVIKHLDKGQGVTTGLTTIVAEELDADWSQMDFAFAPANHTLYANLLFDPIQGTGGSTAIANSWVQLRKAGAAAREMLISAAADEWGVRPSDIRIEKGILIAGDKRSPFGPLAAKAALKPVPADPKLKDPQNYVFVGKEGATHRLDSASKTSGKAVFSLDIRRPGMLRACVAHPPKFGGRLKSYDDAATRAIKGVVDVVRIPTGVAVLATNTWAAIEGRKALKTEWDFTVAETHSSDAIMTRYKQMAARRGLPAHRNGDAVAALAGAATTIESTFEFPHLAHASMEPVNGVIERRADGGIEAWGGFQMQTIDQAVIAAVCGVSTDKVTINTVFAGGSFGRRALPSSDWAGEMAHILKAINYKAPVHYVMSREDDMTNGFYRPMAYHRIRAGLNEKKEIAGWEHMIVSKPVMAGTPMETTVMSRVDHSIVEGAADTVYALPNHLVEAHPARDGVPVLWWRSVGHSHTAHAMEVMMDQLAHLAGMDPVAFRRPLLRNDRRMAAVLDLVVAKSGWGSAAPAGTGRGLAIHKSFGTRVAMVAEASVKGTEIVVPKIVAAVDCGLAINPDIIRAQIEGSVGFGLSSVLRNKITLKDGEVVETNYDGFEPTRFAEMPKVEVHIMPSNAAPSGIGEPGVPVLAPAIANAVFAATGRRLRSLPLNLSEGKEV